MKPVHFKSSVHKIKGRHLVQVFHYEADRINYLISCIDMELYTQSLRERISALYISIPELHSRLMGTLEFIEDYILLSVQLASLVETRKILSQVLNGFVFISSQNVAYKDLKPENGLSRLRD